MIQLYHRRTGMLLGYVETQKEADEVVRLYPEYNQAPAHEFKPTEQPAQPGGAGH